MKPVVILGAVLAVLAVVLFFQFSGGMAATESEKKAAEIRENVKEGMDWTEVYDSYKPQGYMVHGDSSGVDGTPQMQVIFSEQIAAAVSDGSYTQGFRFVYFISTEKAVAVEFDSSGKVTAVNDYTPPAQGLKYG